MRRRRNRNDLIHDRRDIRIELRHIERLKGSFRVRDQIDFAPQARRRLQDEIRYFSRRIGNPLDAAEETQAPDRAVGEGECAEALALQEGF